ncbi:hypothetical protein OAF85_01615 [Planctomycetota bacterium]|nr:hypothetical protein [Planctomycetota bacterium]
MNRITAILLACATLLTHTLVVHRDLSGAFGPPYESAYVAFQLALNFVSEGALVWWLDPVSGETFGGLWSYPSPILVFVSSAFEWVHLPVARGVQVTGIVSVLATIWLCTRFDLTRILSVVSAVLLVSCGAVAAAGGSGTEWPIVMALGTAAFVALEKGRPLAAAMALALLTISTSVAVILVVALLAQTLIRAEVFGSTARARRVLYFLPAAATLWLVELAGGSLLSGVERIFTSAPANAAEGMAHLRDFCVATVSPILLIYPLIALCGGELSPVGRRALALVSVWCAATVMSGGGPETYDLGFVPALPFAFIAIQEGLRRALDTYRPNIERLTWVSILVASLGSLAVNRFPGEPSTTETPTLTERVLASSATRWPVPHPILGRSSLHQEVRSTNRIRWIGEFLSERLPEDTTLLSPWPGAIGYLGRYRVIDLFGRTEALPGHAPAPWSPRPPAPHIAAALGLAPDYILPWLNGFKVHLKNGGRPAFRPGILRLDPDDSPSYVAELDVLMEAYEPLITAGRQGSKQQFTPPLLLLRRRGIFEPPVIQHRIRQGNVLEFVAGFGTPGPKEPGSTLPQVFDTIITVVRADGSRSIVDPTGQERRSLGDGPPPLSMSGLVIDPRWPAATSLLRIPLDALRSAPAVRSVEVRLIHHRLPATFPTSDAAEPYVYELP